MESEGALRAFIKIHSKGMRISTVILDDDSTTKSYLSHSWKDLGISKKDWPTYLNGHRKPDRGKLPLEIPALEFLADRNHQK